MISLNRWYSFVTGGCEKECVGIKMVINPSVINRVMISISIPCRAGQYVIVDNNKGMTYDYYNGKCIVRFSCDTSDVRTLDELLMDISIWFRFRRAVRLDEGRIASRELLRIYSSDVL